MQPRHAFPTFAIDILTVISHRIAPSSKSPLLEVKIFFQNENLPLPTPSPTLLLSRPKWSSISIRGPHWWVAAAVSSYLQQTEATQHKVDQTLEQGEGSWPPSTCCAPGSHGASAELRDARLSLSHPLSTLSAYLGRPTERSVMHPVAVSRPLVRFFLNWTQRYKRRIPSLAHKDRVFAPKNGFEARVQCL